MIALWLIIGIKSLEYELSDDKTIFTAIGSFESLTQQCVRESKLYSLYESATVSEGITGISNSAFSNCISLTSISIGSTVQTVGNNAFEGCSSLEAVVFPTGVKNVGSSIFKSCKELKKVTFSSTMVSLGTSPFILTSNLMRIEIKFNSLFETDTEGRFLIHNKTILAGCVTNQARIVIPACIEVLPNSCFADLTRITSIEFEEGSNLSKVGNSAFYSSKIRSLELPNGTSWLGSYLFVMSSLSLLIIPSTITYADPGIFDRASNLKNVTIVGESTALESVEGIIYTKGKASCLFMPPEIEEINICENTSNIASSALQTKRNLVRVNVSDLNEKFFDFNNTVYNKKTLSLFAVLGGIKYVEVHENCTKIDSLSFAYSIVERVVFLGTKVETISRNAFSSASKLRSLELPNGLKKLEGWSLECPLLTKLVFPSSFLNISDNAITSSGIKEVDFSACIEMRVIDTLAFAISIIEVIKMPPNLLEIRRESFKSTKSLLSIEIPQSVTHIFSKAFESSALQSITFGADSNLISISDSAFSWTKLRNFTFPLSVEEAGESMFEGCTQLSTILFQPNSKLRVLNPRMFAECTINDISLNCPNLSIISECSFTGCFTLKTITVCNENEHFKSINGCIYSRNGTEFIACPCGSEEISIEEKTESITNSAFFECKNLRNVRFGKDSKIENIGRSTFLGCSSLESIEIPPKLSTIEAECFKDCESLSQVVFLAGNILSTIGSSGFRGCNNIESIDLSFCINLKSLNESAFSDCYNLRVIIISKNLRYIGSKCFSNCEALKNVYVCSNEIEEPGDIFSGCSNDIQIFVTTDFKSEIISGLRVDKSLDRDCKIGTFRFTKLGKEENLNKYAGFILGMNDESVHQE